VSKAGEADLAAFCGLGPKRVLDRFFCIFCGKCDVCCKWLIIRGVQECG
jgi:hypothetical protein